MLSSPELIVGQEKSISGKVVSLNCEHLLTEREKERVCAFYTPLRLLQDREQHLVNSQQLCKPCPIVMYSPAVQNNGGADWELFFQHQESGSTRSNLLLPGYGNAGAPATCYVAVESQ